MAALDVVVTGGSSRDRAVAWQLACLHGLQLSLHRLASVQSSCERLVLTGVEAGDEPVLDAHRQNGARDEGTHASTVLIVVFTVRTSGLQTTSPVAPS